MARNLPIAQALQAALNAQFRLIRRHTPGVRRGDPEALHEWRVAVRRLRSFLRAFAPLLRHTSARSCQLAWRALTQRLGPARDADVWSYTLQDPKLRRRLASTPAGRVFLRAQQRLPSRFHALRRQTLSGAEYIRLRAQTQDLLGHRLPARLKDTTEHQREKMTHQAVAKLLQVARHRARRLEATPSPARVHALRRTIRRARYLIETLGDALPGSVPRLYSALLRVQETLGRVHDTDVQLAHLRGLKGPAARQMQAFLQRRRTQALRRYRVAWRKLGRKMNA